MWDLSGSGIEPVSPALQNGFLSTVPPRKSKNKVPFHLYKYTLFFFNSTSRLCCQLLDWREKKKKNRWLTLFQKCSCLWNPASPGGSDSKESACNMGGLGSVPGLGGSPGEGNGNPLWYLAWRIPWTEEPGRVQFMGSQRVRHNGVTKHTHAMQQENSEDKETNKFCGNNLV